jgi:hypothetical protein
VAGWGDDLQGLIDSMADLFYRPEPRVAFRDFLCAMLPGVAKRDSWSLARAVSRLLRALVLRPVDPAGVIEREEYRRVHITRALLSHYRATTGNAATACRWS